MWTKKIWEHHFYTVFIVGNESATTIAVKEENSTGRCDKRNIYITLWITSKYNDTLDEIWVIACYVKEKKSKRNWSMLMSSQDTTLLLYPVMSKCRYPVSAYLNIFQ